ncbi:PEP-CTERM sorting domain-containing protein [Prosthecobacter sp. SYSU 5D2]|uniref:PEP-CTERM sorting domain-containing protein n=1 Tax=Prosthecobacter sp. SYSU 5D2 TaxID=3134134 RepID=UPI0031FEB146
MKLIPFSLKCLLGLLIATGLGQVAQCQTATWNNTGTGAWQEPTNWTWSGATPYPSLPTTTTPVLLNNGGTITVQDTSQSAAAFSINSGTLEVTKASSGGMLTVTGTFYIADAAGSTGSVLLDGAGSVINKTTSGQTMIAARGNGSLTVSNGGKFTTTITTHVGRYAGSNGLLNVKSGGEMAVGTLLMGYQGAATVLVENGGLVKTAGAYVAGYGQDLNRNAGTANVTVTGTGSKWTATSFYVGHSGVGSLVVNDSGVVENSSTAYIGFYNGAEGASPAPIYGTGTATIETGGAWRSTGALSIGTGGSTGTLNVATAGLMQVGAAGAGTITLGAGGAVNIGADPLLADAVPAAPGIISAATLTSTAAGRALTLFHSDVSGGYYLTKTGAAAGAHVALAGGLALNALAGTTTLVAGNTFTGGSSIGGYTGTEARLIINHEGALGSGPVVVKNNGVLEVAGSLAPITLQGLTLEAGSALAFDAHPSGGSSDLVFTLENNLSLVAGETEKITIHVGNAAAITDPELYDWAFLEVGGDITGDVASLFEVVSDLPGMYVFQRDGFLVLGAAVIPEPGRAVLLLAGFMGLGLRRRSARVPWH